MWLNSTNQVSPSNKRKESMVNSISSNNKYQPEFGGSNYDYIVPAIGVTVSDGMRNKTGGKNYYQHCGKYSKNDFKVEKGNLPIITEHNNTNMNMSRIDEHTNSYELNTIKNLVDNMPIQQQNIFAEINKADNGFDVYYQDRHVMNEDIFKKKRQTDKYTINIINNYNFINPMDNEYTQRRSTLKPIKPNSDMLSRELGFNKRLTRTRYNSKIKNM
jgi:hypothetical protein